MSFSSLLVHSLTIQNLVPGATDRYGNEIETWDAGVVLPARVEQMDALTLGRELIIDRDTRQTFWRVFMEADAPVNGLSKVIWEGRTLEVDGEPADVADGVGSHHLEFRVKETKG